MASSNENVSMALFCDFENVALGVRDANYDRFDIKPVLERLLLKGSIVVKKAYCDWDRYKGFKAPMHEANFELIEIPHVRQSGKNSADIRMVVDALDLCYTKAHVDTFVIISGDSDFSPLVSKLRENAKKVIGVGVKQSTSDLLVANCDEFIFYDDLVRESRRARRDAGEAKPAVKRSPEEERARREEMDKRRNQAVEIAINTFEALVLERGDSGKIWASVLKEAIKRRKPDFSESYYGFRTFGNLIEECKARGLLEFGRDEKSGAYVYRGSGVPNGAAPAVVENGAEGAGSAASAQGDSQAQGESRRSRNRGRTAAERFAERQAERLARQGRSAQPEGDASAITIETAPQADVNAAEPVAELADAAQAAHQAEQAQAEVAADAQAPAQGAAREGRERGRNRGGRDRGARNERNTVAAVAAVDAGAEVAPVAQQDKLADDAAIVVDTAPVVLEAAVDLPVPASVEAAVEAVPPKKKSGAKPPARKLKAAAKAPAEGNSGNSGKPGKGGKGKQASQPAVAATVATPAAAVPADPVPTLSAHGAEPAAVPSAAAVAPAAPAPAPVPAPSAVSAPVSPAADAAASAAADKPAKPARAKPARAKPAPRAPKAAKPAKADAAADGADE